MSPFVVFFRTLLKSSAIFIGSAAIVLHPSLEWRPALQPGTSVGAQQSGTEAAVDALIGALKDTDAGVRREAARALAQMDSRRAVPALAGALGDTDPQIRAAVASALGELGDPSAVDALIGAAKDK